MRRFVALARPAALGLFAALCLSAPGCGSKEVVPELVPVTGKVTFRGQPLADASMVFMPSDPDEEEGLTTIVRATATTDAEGGFELAWGDLAGAPPGKYNVIVIAFQPRAEGADDEERPKSLIPEKYSNPQTSGLTAVVKEEGENVFNFNLAQ